MGQTTLLKLENKEISKSLNKLKGKQPLSSKASSKMKAKKSATKRLLDSSDSEMESPSEGGSSS